jgi:glutaryl-CoA dehydrogenase
MSVDFYEFESLLSEEERSVRDTARRWVDEELMPHVADWYMKGEFPTFLVPKMGEMGFLGPNLPQKYGCAGLNNVAYGLLMQELERCDSGIRSFASVQGSLAMYPIFTFGSEEQKKHWLPKMAKGEAIGGYALTEPDYGSNPGGMITKARQDGDSWVLNGRKRWVTNASDAAFVVVWAKTGETDDPRSIRGFLVPPDADGVTVNRFEDKLSLRISDSTDMILEDVVLPESALLPNCAGLKCPLKCLTQARYGIAWGAIGVAKACYEHALNYAKDRVMFDRPIAGYQLQQERLVEMVTEITKAQFFTLQLGRLKDRGTMTPQQVSMAKRNNVDMAAECAREARRLLGAVGILAEHHVMRHMANMETVYTYEGTHDMHTLIVGETITGLNAFSG